MLGLLLLLLYTTAYGCRMADGAANCDYCTVPIAATTALLLLLLLPQITTTIAATHCYASETIGCRLLLLPRLL